MITLNVKTLNELLKEHGQDTSMSAKQAVWKLKGLDRRLGRYDGTSIQVNALTKSLKNNPVPKTYAERLLEVLRTLPSTTFAATPPAPTPIPGPTPTPVSTPVLTPTTLPSWLTAAAKPIEPAPQIVPPPPIIPPSLPVPTSEMTALQTQIQKIQETVKQAEVAGYKPTEEIKMGTMGEVLPPTAKDTAKYLALPDLPTAEEITKTVMESPEFKLAQERLGLDVTTEEGTAEAAKATLEVKYGGLTTQLENNLAAKGLAFSGIRTEQVKALADELTASKLGVDRKLASALLDANLDLQEIIMKSAADVVKEAQEGRKEAIAQLNKVGLAVMPDGTLAPTLEAQRAEAAEVRAEAAAIRAEESLEISRKRLELAEQKAGEPTATETLRKDMSATTENIKGYIRTSLRPGADGFYEPQDYELMEDAWAANFPDKMGTFYQLFPPEMFINPKGHPNFIKARRASFDPWAAMFTPTPSP